jgi:AraC-like DNA-binding protein
MSARVRPRTVESREDDVVATYCEAAEVDDFATALAGLEVEYVRTDVGDGPCRMTTAGSESVRFSTGTMGFSAISRTEVPDDVVVFSVITCTPPGALWCGVDATPGQLHVYGPGTSFVGINPGGLSAAFLVVDAEAIDRVAAELGTIVKVPRSVEPLRTRPSVERLRDCLWRAAVRPETMDDVCVSSAVLGIAVEALADDRLTSQPRSRRLDSRTIVLDCLDHVDRLDVRQPTMTELCRAACASESVVRRAFVEVLGVPPHQYFQYRLLSRLRDDLLGADPANETVTNIASSLGITQLGRTSGRYRQLYDELPRETLRRERRFHAERRRPDVLLRQPEGCAGGPSANGGTHAMRCVHPPSESRHRGDCPCDSLSRSALGSVEDTEKVGH